MGVADAWAIHPMARAPHSAFAKLSLAALPLLVAACGAAADDPQPAVARPDASTLDATQDAPLGSDADATLGEGDAGNGEGGSDASITGDATSDVGVTPDAPDAPSGLLLDPAIACAPKGAACALAAADPRTFVGFRKDYFLPSAKYDEPNADPKDGGRFQIAGIAKATGSVTDVTLDGASADTMLEQPKLEWLNVWPKHVVAGEPIWVAFHSRDPKWASGGTARVVVKTGAGDALDVTVSAASSPLRVTYVTTSADLGELVVHVRNEGSAPKTLTKLLIGGRDALAPDVACVAERTLAPGTTTLITVPLCTKPALGAPWTVVAEAADGTTAVGAGRVIRPFFPIETWPNSSDCPFPAGGKADNLKRHLDAGFDTFFMYQGGGGSGCSQSTLDIVNNVAPTRDDFWPFLADDFTNTASWQTLLTNTSRVSGTLLGDEVDGEVYDAAGNSKAADKLRRSQAIWDAYPGIPTYIGAKTNRNVGSFAGVTDIQGADFYVAACAPHITRFGTHPPIVAAYDYLRNTRDNHMPLPTWLYAQGLSPVWNKKAPVIGTDLISQPDPQEIVVQGLSAMAAGAKGLMWFQTNQDEAVRAPARWSAISNVNHVVRGVREYLRTGDLLGAKVAGGDAIVEAIRAKDAIVVPVIGTKSTAQPTDLACQQGLIGAGAIPHWVMASQTLSVSLEVPRDFGVAEVFEVTAAGPKSVTGVTISGRTLTIAGVSVDNASAARVFVIARTTGVRGDVAAKAK